MATRGEQARSATMRANSAARRTTTPTAAPGKSERLKAATAKSAHGRALHGRTKLQADAKAGKPDPGRITGFWQTGPHGGEDQTFNGVVGPGRGADGPADRRKVSRKSTRGAVAGGEKANTQAREVRAEVSTPERRAANASAHRATRRS